jgi:hypothetical protein
MEPRQTTTREVLFVGLMLAAVIAACGLYLDRALREVFQLQPLTNRELIVMGRPAPYQADFIERISRDLKINKSVELVLGPPLVFPRGRLAESTLAYYILIEEKFFLSLTDMEQKALIGHEMGHIIFLPPNCDGYMSCQLGADLFAVLYTSPQAVIDLLEKLSDDPNWKQSLDYTTRVPALEKLKGKPLPSTENLLLFKRP